MIRWNLSLSEATGRAVRREILRRTVQEVQVQNADLTEEEALGTEAVLWARAHPAWYQHYHCGPALPYRLTGTARAKGARCRVRTGHLADATGRITAGAGV